MFQLQKWRFPGLGGQGVAVAMRAAVGPIETIVSVAKAEVSRPGGQAVCFLEASCTKVRHAQRSEEVRGLQVSRAGGQAVCFQEALSTKV